VKFHRLLYQEDVTSKHLVVPLGFAMTADSAGEEPGPIKITAISTPARNYALKIQQMLSSPAEFHHKDFGN